MGRRSPKHALTWADKDGMRWRCGAAIGGMRAKRGDLQQIAGRRYAMCGPDDLDHRLIALLRSNSRTPLALLARERGINRATVPRRLHRLADQRVRGSF